MNALVLELAYPVIRTLETSSDSGGLMALLLLGPAGAAGVYWGLFRYYRNTDKSHGFEKETLIEAQPVTGDERKVDTVRGTTRTKIPGDNVSDHRERVQRSG
ncbi:hypothetical protein [Nocardioides houyundeii]|uniref:hypothetical protein n=1 Tax=Nocardioides houyundeii TaxID=2045452 RepID=UPI0018F039A9|nr:hypothetical protein [Nocardioides houyundeii]